MTASQMFWLIFVGIFIGAGLGVALTILAAIQFDYLPGVKFPWKK